MVLYLQRRRPSRSVPEIFTTVKAATMAVDPARQRPTSCAELCSAQGSNRRSTARMSFDTPPPRPCSAEALAGRCRRCSQAPRYDNDGSLREDGFRTPLRDLAALAGGGIKLITDVERYVALRQTLWLGLREVSMNLQAFARFAAERGETPICAATAVVWTTRAVLPLCSLCSVARRHRTCPLPVRRGLRPRGAIQSLPSAQAAVPAYIDTPEAVLEIRRAKLGKSRLVPLRRWGAVAKGRYLESRRPSGRYRRPPMSLAREPTD